MHSILSGVNRHFTLSASLLIAAVSFTTFSSAMAAQWAVTEEKNPHGPGKVAMVKRDGKQVAALVFGEGQFKTYLHVYGTQGELLTNGGLDAEGKTAGKFPHHRGIYIGWNKITSDLGSADCWHMKGGSMEITKLEPAKTTADSATLVAKIAWRAEKKDANDSNLLVNETRTLVISQPDGKTTQVDAKFELQAARDLNLGGDLQHAGIHFRAAGEVADRVKETSYLWEPVLPAGNGKIVSDQFKWCRLLFPVGQNWYTSTELNAPTNPIKELSWRDYGRFGFFFDKAMKKDESLTVNYRFLIASASAPEAPGKESAEQKAKSRAASDAAYAAYVKSLKK